MIPISSDILLTPDEMASVDRMAAESGISSYGLMEQAGRAVAATVLREFPAALRVAVLCGPGNNGGDGHVAARVLADSGVAVEVFLLRDPATLKADAATACANSPLMSQPLDAFVPRPGDVVVDALFGAGLSRTVPEAVAEIMSSVGEAGVPVVAVDLPSGIHGRTGQVLGAAFRARHTVTFMARKPGHLLLPGREYCGTTEVCDIGIPWRIVAAQAGNIAENTPVHWRNALPAPGGNTHKFSRGHLVVFSGRSTASGAARLSAASGLRTGAGLVTIAAPPSALAVNAAHLTAVMLQRIEDEKALSDWIIDRRLSAFVLGPGFGIGEKARAFALALKDRPLVLDADGITTFREQPESLFEAFAAGAPHLVLTPHEGEFARLFPDLAADAGLGKIERARKAARRANAAIVYKGADTVIAAPDGRALINTNAPPWLATAGSGDVLAGIIGGLMAGGVPTFEAAAAGVWLHGAAGAAIGPGLTAERLADAVMPFAG